MAFEDLHRPLGQAGFKGAIRWIILLSGAILIAQQFAGSYLTPYLGLVPVDVLRRFWLWQPFTYLFLHGGLFHWLFNMFILWMFGRELETRWGTVEFVKYFFITGVGAAITVLALSPNSSAPTIGCSGAVFGMLTAFAMIFPDATMYLYFVIPVKAWQAAALFAFIEFFAGMAGGGVGVSRFAHLGGMLTGYLYLRFGWQTTRTLSAPWVSVSTFFRQRRRLKPKPPFEFHEVTDELVVEVDRILEKVSKKGVESLSTKEREMMDRYAKLRK